jgi:hypothetical protein
LRHSQRRRCTRKRRPAIGPGALKGRYRQVADAYEANSGFALAFVYRECRQTFVDGRSAEFKPHVFALDKSRFGEALAKCQQIPNAFS